MSDRHRSARAAIHLAGVWAIAVAHPLLEVLGEAPEFFVAHRAAAADILLLTAALLLGLPVVLAGAVALAGVIGSRTRTTVTAVFLAVLVALIAVQAAKQAGVTTWSLAVPGGILAGIAAAALYTSVAAVRTFFTVLSVAVVIVPVAFAQQPGMVRLLLPQASGSVPAERGQAGLLPAPVVIMVFDELPLISLLDAKRQIDPALYPNLSNLARDGVWFRNATTVSDYTRWAVPPIVTGRRPSPDDIPTSGDHPDTLFSFFGRTHRLEVLESATNLCPRSLCADADDGMWARLARMGGDLMTVAAYVFLTPDLHERLDLPDLTGNWAGFGDDAGSPAPSTARAWQRGVHRRFRSDRREEVREFVASIDASDPQPTFYFLHALLPHQPWVLLPNGKRNSSLAPLPSAMRVVARNDDWEIAQNQQRHLLQVGYVDHAVGQVVSRLKQVGLYERALVVITADHGVAITRGQPVRTFSPATAAEIMRVPLLIKFPSGMVATAVAAEVNAAGQNVSDRNVETIDIAPTVAHVLGAPLPWASDGSSILDPSVPPRSEKLIGFGSGRSSRRYGAEGPPMDALLQQRQATFGSSNVYRIPRPPRFAELVGRRVTDARILESSANVDLRFSWQYQNIDPDAEAVPFDVSGQLHREANGQPAYIAVAINGVIRAVTRTWTSRPGGWLATPPLDAWKRGENSVEVFLVEDTDGEPRLARVRTPTSRPEDLNLISGAAQHYWNIRQRGFHRHEGKGKSVFRWTRADAAVTVPLLGRTPAAIHVKIARAADPRARLEITVNGCRVHDGVIPRREWEARLPLDGCRLSGDELTIRLTTSGMRPRRGRDTRVLGVAVRHVILETRARESAARR